MPAGWLKGVAVRNQTIAVPAHQSWSRVFVMSDLKSQIFAIISDLVGNDDIVISDETALLGDGSVLDSMKVVTLCIALEDLAADLDFDFDWTSDAAMSRSRSMFRSAGALVAEFQNQQAAAAA
jgi:acyl carrier protein